jgi:transcriptional regulator with GAF, ATPase, and Fis domain
LITGETGTGKELIAAAIHYNSPRRDGAFIKVNCAALQDTLLESDLFGHEKGAFTGAVRQRLGRFEQAHGGTLFLDEIGDMSPAIQAKVLRVLQSQEFERVGGTRVIRVNVRLIAATNQVLEKAMRAGAFREDLYYRLKVVTIHLPPLRERVSDIPLLARFFLKKARFEERRPARDFEPEALHYLQDYPWPGNVRELENTIMQAVLLSDVEQIRRQDLILFLRSGSEPAPAFPPPVEPEPSYPDAAAASLVDLQGRGPSGGPAHPSSTPGQGGLDLVERERRTILEALETASWVQSRAARSLGISPRALHYRIVKHGITHPSWRVHRPTGVSD